MTQKRKYYLSPYHYEDELQMVVAQNKKPKNIEIKGNEAAIIRTLAKYRLLNKNCIAIVVNRSLPEERKKPDFEKEIGILFKGGYIRKYYYPDMESGRGNVVFFALTERGIAYGSDKQMKFTYVPLKDTEKYETAAVLETATLNLWHIRLMDCYSSYIRNEGYCMPVRVLEDKNAIIPSCIALKNSEWSLLKEFTVAAIPFCKKDAVQAQGAFLNSLLSINAFLNENRKLHKRSFIIVLTDSFKQMEKASDIIYSYQPLQKLQVYFAIDEYVNDENPLQWLYEVDRDTGKNTTKFLLIDLTQKIKEQGAKEPSEKTRAGKEKEETE